MEHVNYDEFKKMDMRMGWIRFVEPIEGTDKLLRFEIDFGELSKDCINECEGSCDCDVQCDKESCLESCICELPVFGKMEYKGRDVRQIVSGIKEYYPQYEALVGKKALYILNLEPRDIRGITSYGMLMAIDGVDGKPVFVIPEGVVHAGSKIR
jgi:tRNA-binding EMAP/Myf-like protein